MHHSFLTEFQSATILFLWVSRPLTSHHVPLSFNHSDFGHKGLSPKRLDFTFGTSGASNHKMIWNTSEVSQINCLYFRSMCGQFGADLKTPNILVEWNGYPEILRLSRDWEIFSWAIFAPLNSYFMEKKSLAAPSTSLALTQLTFSRSIRASSNSELSLFLAFSALLAFCEAVESASSVSASFWVSFFLQESISVKK